MNVKGLTLQKGILFSENDGKNNESVAVSDDNTLREVFKNDNPNGKILMLNKKPLRDIGRAVT
ncbi:ABC transporter permease [[Pasteurella] aerogenes]